MAHDQLSLLSPMYGRYHYGQSTGVTAEVRRLLQKKRFLQLRAEDFFHFDQEHFLGLEPVKLAIDALRIKRLASVVDIGSGLGGPARYIAEQTQALVDAVEVQPQRAQLSRVLNSLASCDDKVRVINADFCALGGCVGRYDAAISLLAILHFTDKHFAHQRVFESLKPGARFFVEDYVSSRDLTSEESDTLLRSLAFPRPLQWNEYLSSIESVGFRILETNDTTLAWNEQVQARSHGFPERRAILSGDYDEDQLADLGSFFSEVSSIFDRGLIRGIRLIAEKREDS